MNETQVSFNNKKVEFEKLRSDVQIKLKFLDENRVSHDVCSLLCYQHPHDLGEGDGPAAADVQHRCVCLFLRQPGSS